MEKLWYYPLVGWIVVINPVFLELIEKVENWGEDWIWHVRIYSNCWINCQNLLPFFENFHIQWKMEKGVNNGYVKFGCIAHAEYELWNCFDFRMHSKHGNRDKQIYCSCKLDRWKCTLNSRKKILGRGVVVGRLSPGEVNNFSRYFVGSPAQSLRIIRQISLSLRRLFCWKRECSLPHKIFISMQVLVLCFTTVMFWLLKRVCILFTPLEFKSI